MLTSGWGSHSIAARQYPGLPTGAPPRKNWQEPPPSARNSQLSPGWANWVGHSPSPSPALQRPAEDPAGPWTWNFTDVRFWATPTHSGSGSSSIHWCSGRSGNPPRICSMVPA